MSKKGNGLKAEILITNSHGKCDDTAEEHYVKKRSYYNPKRNIHQCDYGANIFCKTLETSLKIIDTSAVLRKFEKEESDITVRVAYVKPTISRRIFDLNFQLLDKKNRGFYDEEEKRAIDKFYCEIDLFSKNDSEHCEKEERQDKKDIRPRKIEKESAKVAADLMLHLDVHTFSDSNKEDPAFGGGSIVYNGVSEKSLFSDNDLIILYHGGEEGESGLSEQFSTHLKDFLFAQGFSVDHGRASVENRIMVRVMENIRENANPIPAVSLILLLREERFFTDKKSRSRKRNLRANEIPTLTKEAIAEIKFTQPETIKSYFNKPVPVYFTDEGGRLQRNLVNNIVVLLERYSVFL